MRYALPLLIAGLTAATLAGCESASQPAADARAPSQPQPAPAPATERRSADPRQAPPSGPGAPENAAEPAPEQAQPPEVRRRLEKAMQLRQQRRYPQALDQVNRVLRDHPDNQPAQALRNLIQREQRLTR
jgi:hypothetical protein